MGLRFYFLCCFFGLADTVHNGLPAFHQPQSLQRIKEKRRKKKKREGETHAFASALAAFLLLVPVDPELILLPQSNALFAKLITVCALRSGPPVSSLHSVLVGESGLLAPEDWVFIEKCRVPLGEREGGGAKTEGEWEETDGVREMEGAGDTCIKEESYEEWCIVGESVRVCCKPARF